MKNLKITKGEWETNNVDVYSKSEGVVCIVADRDAHNKDIEAIANAQLMADAGTTANKCGKLPSELLAERDELLKVLYLANRELTGALNSLSKHMELTQHDYQPTYEIENLIAKIKGK